MIRPVMSDRTEQAFPASWSEVVGPWLAPTADLPAGAAALARWAGRPPVTVVIPIYGAHRALERCLESLRVAGDPCALVLVDDHSPGSEVERVCRTFAERPGDTQVLRNDRNLGFVGTANRGMTAAAPDHDVVLLNSDTLVTDGWLGRLARTAWEDEATASVCPLSNAAGVFTVPAAYEDRPLPVGWTPALAARVLEIVGPGREEVVPVTSGYCMYLRRDVLDEVGIFDDRLFLRGYGEENDWCMRARQLGRHHRIAAACFVQHERALSFSVGKQRLKRRNSRVLKALHAGHTAGVREWLETSALNDVRRDFASLAGRIDALPEAERALLSASVVTDVRWNPDARITQRGSWADGRREIVVAAAPNGFTVDLFGCWSGTFGGQRDDLRGLLALLGHRFGARRFELGDDPEFRPIRDALSNAFGGAATASTRRWGGDEASSSARPAAQEGTAR
jgi:GT2 family glycosyltransferase